MKGTHRDSRMRVQGRGEEEGLGKEGVLEVVMGMVGLRDCIRQWEWIRSVPCL